MVKHMIWQNFDIDVKDFEEFLEEEYPDVTDENEKWELCAKLNDEYLNDERENLNIPVESGIVVIGDLGRWNGRVKGIGNDELLNINEALVSRCSSMSYNRFYVDEKGDLRQDESHHDGTNHFLFRKWKRETTDEQKEYVRESIIFRHYSDEETDDLVASFTDPLGNDIAPVYGWVA